MSRQLIGVDVGGTKLSVASLSEAGLDRPRTIPTAAAGDQALIDEIVHAVESVRGLDAAAVGVGVPSVVEFATGRVKSSVNVKLADVPLRMVLQERLGLPVFVDNDANCAALAEAHEDTRMVSHDLVMFTVGTGVGGSLESLASGRALDELGAGLQGAEVVAAAHRGDEHAFAAITLLGERLGVGIANAINIFDPELVVVGGGVATAGESLLEPARQTARRFVLPGVGERTEIRLARHGPSAGVLGAALLAGHELGGS